MDWEVLERQELYRGFFRLERLKLRHELFEHGTSGVLVRELVRNKDAVAVLPYDEARQLLVLVEQFRTGATAHDQSPWLMELVAGLIEAGESPAAVARRELMEETGCEALELRPLLTFFPSPGGLSERVHLFLAKVDSAHQAVCGMSVESEDIRTSVVTLEQAYTFLESGRITSANAIIGIQWLRLHTAQTA